jgi:hypothetical protein
MTPTHWAAALGSASACGCAAMFAASVLRTRLPALWAVASMLLLFAAFAFASRALDLALGCPTPDLWEIFG